MEDLIALSKLVSKQKVKKINIITELTSLDQKQTQLYHGLVNGKIKNDADLISEIYNNVNPSKSHKLLKFRLKSRLLDTLFFLDINQPNLTDYNKAELHVHKQWSFVKILLNRNSRKIAIPICENAFNKSIKFGFTDLTILLSRLLMRHFAYIEINKKKYKKYERILFEKLNLLKKELITEKYYADVAFDLETSNSPNSKAITAKLNLYCNELKAFVDSEHSYTLFYFYYAMLSHKYILEKDYQNVKITCQNALSYFTKKNNHTVVAEFKFRQDLHIVSLQLKEYDKAKKLILQNIEMATPYSINWIREWHFYFIWAASSSNYNQMVKCTSLIFANRKIQKLNSLYELWKIKEAYINLLLIAGKIDVTLIKKHNLKRFSINKFLNEVPSFSKDKKGFNVAILIIHLLFLISKNKSDQVLKRIDSLKMYSHRYLKNNENFRSNCFIKMLCKIPDSNYHPIALKRNTKSLLNKLSETQYSYSDNPAEIEVIPYENLWEIVLEILRKKQNKKRA